MSNNNFNVKYKHQDLKSEFIIFCISILNIKLS